MLQLHLFLPPLLRKNTLLCFKKEQKNSKFINHQRGAHSAGLKEGELAVTGVTDASASSFFVAFPQEKWVHLFVLKRNEVCLFITKEELIQLC
jgi:hypothetical protein